MYVLKLVRKYFCIIIEYKMFMFVVKVSFGKWGNSIMMEDIFIVYDEEDRVVFVSEVLVIFELID